MERKANITFNLPTSLINNFLAECEHFGEDVNEVVYDALAFWVAQTRKKLFMQAKNYLCVHVNCSAINLKGL